MLANLLKPVEPDGHAVWPCWKLLPREAKGNQAAKCHQDTIVFHGLSITLKLAET